VPEGANLLGVDNNVPGNTRAIVALAVIYGAFLAEVFRAGIESIPRGQMEAARSLGMTYTHAMRYIILPQAIRNILPALGNDFIAMLKDSSLVSVLAVRDITQQARLYAGSSFRFRETYLVLTFLYLTMTLTLSLILRWYEGRLRRDGSWTAGVSSSHSSGIAAAYTSAGRTDAGLRDIPRRSTPAVHRANGRHLT
jgi:polar amino acid transport system permease protein